MHLLAHVIRTYHARYTVNKALTINGAVRIGRLAVYSSIHHKEMQCTDSRSNKFTKNSTQNTCQGVAIVRAFFLQNGLAM